MRRVNAHAHTYAQTLANCRPPRGIDGTPPPPSAHASGNGCGPRGRSRGGSLLWGRAYRRNRSRHHLKRPWAPRHRGGAPPPAGRRPLPSAPIVTLPTAWSHGKHRPFDREVRRALEFWTPGGILGEKNRGKRRPRLHLCQREPPPPPPSEGRHRKHGPKSETIGCHTATPICRWPGPGAPGAPAGRGVDADSSHPKLKLWVQRQTIGPDGGAGKARKWRIPPCATE